MDDNIWEYPFGELDDEDEDVIFARRARVNRPASSGCNTRTSAGSSAVPAW